MIFKGKANLIGDNIDTDTIIPANYCATFKPEILKTHFLEKYDPDFKDRVKKGNILFAGENFGHGSSREHAPITIKAVGISVIVVRSVARIFYRNSFNIGVPVIECDEAVSYVKNGDEITIDILNGVITIKEKEFRIKPIPKFMQEVIEKGGLIEYYLEKKSY